MKFVPPRTVLITGATDGIGLLLANKYASIGCQVIATGRQFLASSEDLFGTGDITYVRADQSEPGKAAKTILRAMEELGWAGCDLAILNAGIGWTGDPADEKASEIDAQIAVNLRAPVRIAHTLSTRILASNGHLVLIGSTAHTGAAGFATYAATKAGLRGFARSLQEEWNGRARVQIIHPGPVRTSMHEKAGLKLGFARMMFTHPRRAANAIMAATTRSDSEQKVSHMASFWRGWRIPRKLRP